MGPSYHRRALGPAAGASDACAAPLGAVALLVLLAAPAPARVIAADLLLLAEHALLDDRHGLPVLALRLQGRGLGRRGCRRGEGAGAGRAVAPGVGDPAGPRGAS